MEELFQHLEQRIRKLLKKVEYLQVSNERIEQGKQSLSRDNERLLTRHKGVVTQIENIVARLKALEGLQ